MPPSPREGAGLSGEILDNENGTDKPPKHKREAAE
jgi:hypothetical protein